MGLLGSCVKAQLSAVCAHCGSIVAQLSSTQQSEPRLSPLSVKSAFTDVLGGHVRRAEQPSG